MPLINTNETKRRKDNVKKFNSDTKAVETDSALTIKDRIQPILKLKDKVRYFTPISQSY